MDYPATLKPSPLSCELPTANISFCFSSLRFIYKELPALGPIDIFPAALQLEAWEFVPRPAASSLHSINNGSVDPRVAGPPFTGWMLHLLCPGQALSYVPPSSQRELTLGRCWAWVPAPSLPLRAL